MENESESRGLLTIGDMMMTLEHEIDRLRALNAELVEALEGPLLSNSVVYHSPEVLARVRAALAKAKEGA